MTCRDLLTIEHPEQIDETCPGGCGVCPDDYGYAGTPDYCSSVSMTEDEKCTLCWDRYADSEAVEKLMAEIYKISDVVSVNNMSVEELKDAYNAATKQFSTDEPRILDSGDRTEFESGAVRDMRKGKGRCDLLPLDVVAGLMSTERSRDIFEYVERFQKEGDVRFLYDALIRFSEDYIGNTLAQQISHMLLEVAKQFEEGAAKYGDDNWRKGIPSNVYIDSAIRHYLKYLRGDKDEPHGRAFCWNILCCIWTVKHIEGNKGDE